VLSAGALLIAGVDGASAQLRGIGNSIGSVSVRPPVTGSVQGGGAVGGLVGGGLRGPGAGLYNGIGAGLATGVLHSPPVYGNDVASPPQTTPGRKKSRQASSSGPANSRSSNNGGLPPAGETRYLPDEVILAFSGNPSEPTIAGLARQLNLLRLEQRRIGLANATVARWRIPDRRSVPAVIRALQARSVFAQPNYLYELQQDDRRRSAAPGAAPEQPIVPAAVPPAPEGAARSGQGATIVGPTLPAPSEPTDKLTEGDPAQYALGKLHLPQAHGLAKGENVLVAVIDTGIDAEHPDLAGTVVDQFDALAGVEGPQDHGTGIAGVIAAHGRLMGAAPAVHVLAVRAFGTTQGSAQGTTFNIVKGLDWAVARGARLVNMSFAGPADPTLQKAMASAHDKGTVLIAAAGNAGPNSPPLYPAADPNAIAVTAVDGEDRIFERANRGSYVALSAPGVDILTPAPGEAYRMSSGTSFAAAYVSGIAALMLDRKPALTADALKSMLLSTARDLGPKGRDEVYGQGLADAYQAVSAVMPATIAGAGSQ
jgi:hypothetical protein